MLCSKAGNLPSRFIKNCMWKQWRTMEQWPKRKHSSVQERLLCPRKSSSICRFTRVHCIECTIRNNQKFQIRDNNRSCLPRISWRRQRGSVCSWRRWREHMQVHHQIIMSWNIWRIPSRISLLCSWTWDKLWKARYCTMPQWKRWNVLVWQLRQQGEHIFSE